MWRDWALHWVREDGPIGAAAGGPVTACGRHWPKQGRFRGGEGEVTSPPGVRPRGRLAAAQRDPLQYHGSVCRAPPLPRRAALEKVFGQEGTTATDQGATSVINKLGPKTISYQAVSPVGSKVVLASWPCVLGDLRVRQL